MPCPYERAARHAPPAYSLPVAFFRFFLPYGHT